MAFGFGNKTFGRAPVGGAKPKVPKSVQDVINNATASLAARHAQWGSPPITPAGQTNTSPFNPLAAYTGAGFGASGGAAPQMAGGGGGGGGGQPITPPGGSLPPQGTDAYSGWMARFNPSDFQNEVYNDPQIVLNRMFADSGLGTESPAYSTLRSLNGADPMSLYLLTQGGTQFGALSGERYGNFLHSLYGNQMTPGGRTIDFNEALANLRGAGAGANADVSKQSALYQQLTRGGAPEQFRAYYGLAQDAAKMGLPPAIASAFLDALARQGDTYLSQAAQSSGGNVPSFYNYASHPVMG